MLYLCSELFETTRFFFFLCNRLATFYKQLNFIRFMKKFAMLIVCLVSLGMQSLYAQNKTLSGTVTSAEDNQTLPGVNVFVKGTTLGTITNFDGAFELKVSEGATTLVFSYIGMQTQEVEIGSQTTFNITLQPDAIGVEEVVVTALGIKKEAKALGYAVQEVKAEKLNKVGTSDLSRALQGKVAGVDIKVSSGMPGASSQFIIRGSRSFTGDNTPLYVVDGMPVASTSPYTTGDGVTGADVANRSVDINPSDIESINILKGQAAAALYGMRASNGVVIITTKSGKGGIKDKTIVTISENVSFDVVSRKPEYQTTYAQGTNGRYVPNTSMAWGCKIEDLPKDPTYGGDANGNEGKYYVPQRKDAGLDPWVTPKVYDNWSDYFKTGVTSTSSIGVSRATDEGSYAASLGYTNQTGIALNTGMKRWTGNLSTEKKLGKYFTSGFSGNFSNVNIDKLTGANDGSLVGILACPPSYDLKGIPSHAVGDEYTQVYYRGLIFDNPYWVENNNTFNEETSRFIGNANIVFDTDINETMKVNAKYQIGTDFYNTHYQDIFGYGSRGGSGQINNYGFTSTKVNSLLLATYDWKVLDNANLNVILGNEFDQEHTKTYDEYGLNFNYGGWNHIENTETQQASESQNDYRTVGFFYNISFDFNSMIYLNTTGRNDIVSRMPRGNRSFFYPSVSLGFVASEISALKDLDWLSFAKGRVSYAEVGMPGTYRQDRYVTPGYGGGFWNKAPIVYPIEGVSAFVPSSTLYSSNLEPQNTKTFELGLDLKFFDNRLGIDYTYSKQNVTSQIFDVPLAGSTGAAEIKMNSGKVHTNTHEVMLYTTPIRTKTFEWNINLNYTKMDNILDELAEGVESIFLGGFVDPQVRLGVGYNLPVIYGVSFARDEQGRVLVDENPSSLTYGMPMPGPEKVLGSVAPKFIAGLSTDVSYKNLSLSAVFEWKNGGKMYHGSNNSLDMYGVSKNTEDRTSTFVYDAYKADGTPNDIVRGGEYDSDAYQTLYCDVLGNISEAAIYGNSFVKLREVALKYQLPSSLISKATISLTAFARNLLLWTELPNFDPESSQGNDNMMGGFERFSLPQTKSFGFGIELKF